MQMRPEFFDVYLELAVEFGLPVRLSAADMERSIGFPFRRLAAEEGVVFPDRVVPLARTGSRAAFERALHGLDAGVTEIAVHPAIDTPELRAAAPDWSHRVDDHDMLVKDQAIGRLIERAGVTLIGYRELRELQRRA
jgi:hypothetical protein